MAQRKRSTASLKRRRERLAQRLPDLERVLRGSLVQRFRKCGKPGCHCVEDGGHGPTYYLSLTLAPGKTRSYYVFEEQRRRIARYLDNNRKLRELVEDIVSVNRELLERGELDDPT